MAIDYRGLRSLTARELIAALNRDGSISSARSGHISVMPIRTDAA